jgi:hypothetical protein
MDSKAAPNNSVVSTDQRDPVARRTGRPSNVPSGRWQHQDLFDSVLRPIMFRKDRTDEETLTLIRDGLFAAARQSLGVEHLTQSQEERLKELVLAGKPSVVSRTLQAWQSGFSDPKVRQLRRELSDIEELRWA